MGLLKDFMKPFVYSKILSCFNWNQNFLQSSVSSAFVSKVPSTQNIPIKIILKSSYYSDT